MDWQNLLFAEKKLSSKSEFTLKNLNSLLFLIESIKEDLDLDKIFFTTGHYLNNLNVSVVISILDKNKNIHLRHFFSKDEKINDFYKQTLNKFSQKKISLEDYFVNIEISELEEKNTLYISERLKGVAKQYKYNTYNIFSKINSIIVPMILRDEILGYIEFFSNEIEKDQVGIYEYFTKSFVKSIANIILFREAKESEHRYKDLFENANEGFAIIDVNKKRFIEINSSLINISGYTKQELFQMNAVLLIVEEEREFVLKKMTDIFLQNNKNYVSTGFEAKLLTKDKNIKFVTIKISRIIRESELFLIVNDISEEKKSLEKIKNAKIHYESVIDSIQDGICVIDRDMKILSFNRRFINGVRLPVNKIKNAKCSDVIPLYGNGQLGRLCNCHKSSRKCDIIKVFHSKNIKVIEKKIEHNDIVAFYTIRLYPSINAEGEVYQVVIIISDVTQSKLVEKKIQALQEFQKMILDNIPVSIVVMDKEGKIVSMNLFAQKLISEKMLGRRLIDAEEIKKKDYLVGKYNKLIAEGEPFYHENLTYINSKSKKSRSLDLIAVPIFDSDNNINGAISMALDNTEEVKTKLALSDLNKSLENKILSRTKELDIANKKLNKALELKSKFISDASHELRTPLTIIQGNLELATLEAKQNEEEIPELYDILQYEVNQISGILSDLTMLTNADSGAEKIMFEKICLQDVLSSCIKSLKVIACQAKIDINFKNGSSKVYILGDEAKLERMFLNILRNAIKYTDANGRINIEIKTDGLAAVVSIEDNGIGIPEKDLPNIFERFYRVDKARSRQEGGTGLGLSICKWIADTHSGKITVESQEGVGTTFFVHLPLLIPEGARPDKK